MLLPLESLNKEIARRVALWHRQLVTVNETAGCLLDHFAFATKDFPDGWPTIVDVLNTVPEPLVAEMWERLTYCRNALGSWRWPPAGMGLPTPGPAVARVTARCGLHHVAVR